MRKKGTKADRRHVAKGRQKTPGFGQNMESDQPGDDICRIYIQYSAAAGQYKLRSSIVKLVLYQKPCQINSIGFCCLRILYVLWLWDSGANLPTFYSTIAEFLFLFLSLFLSLVEREIFAYLSQISLLLLYNRVVLIISFLSYFVSKKKSIHLKEDPIKVRNKKFCFFFILEKTQCNIQFTSICLKSILRIFTSSWQNIFPVFPLFSVYNNTVSRSFYFIILACNC